MTNPPKRECPAGHTDEVHLEVGCACQPSCSFCHTTQQECVPGFCKATSNHIGLSPTCGCECHYDGRNGNINNPDTHTMMGEALKETEQPIRKVDVNNFGVPIVVAEKLNELIDVANAVKRRFKLEAASQEKI